MASLLLAANGLEVSPLAAAPFVLMLGAIAVLPLVVEHWWHPNRHKGMVVAVLAVPTAIYLFTQPGGSAALLHELESYFSFIIFLTTLYVISGGILVRGTFPPSPRVNACFLLVGVLLANVIGTTGASMLLIRPLLRINARRRNRVHVPVFFIFTVSNCGGLLTPLGDPPLFLGFVEGVSFFWTLTLWPQWLVMNGLLLAVFLFIDWRAGREERPDLPPIPHEPFRVDGWLLNGTLMLVAVGTVIAKPHLPFGMYELLMGGCVAISMKGTRAEVHILNGFAWGPMVEVAVLFAGIFITMVPALALLNAHGDKLGLTHAWQFFWVTGVLSSILDNAPTYLTIGTVAAGHADLATLSTANPQLLAAVSCGAVFMGANSYIGNGPNFMVKAIAEETGYRMPSFFRYGLYAALVLGPLHVLVTILFFWQ